MAVRYVNTASTPGGDGTTNATTGANRAYASLNEWEAARQASLTEVEECICEGAAADTAATTIDGWTTSAANYIYIHTSAAGRHDGKWNTGKYRLEHSTGGASSALSLNEDFIRIEGLQILSAWVDSSYKSALGIANVTAGAEIRISHNIMKGAYSGTTNNVFGIRYVYLSAISVTYKAWDNIIYDFINGANAAIYGIYHGAGSAAIYYTYNNTIYNSYIGFYRGIGTCYAKNNISYNNTDNYNGSFDASSTNNLSGPTQTDAPGSNPRNGVTVTFADESGDDFHLTSSDAGARDYGTDLSGDAGLAFSDDIDGQTRSGSWDIGADEYVSGGGGLIQLISETTQLSDSRYRTMTLRRYKNETINISEGILNRNSLRRFINESLTIIDSISKKLEIKRLIAETIQISESVLSSTLTLINKIINETLQISDSILGRKLISRFIAETIQIADSLYHRISLRRFVSETLQVNDSILKQITIRRILSETIQISDQAIRSVLGAMVRIVSETLNLIDSNLRRISYRRIISESENIIEALNRQIYFRKILSEFVSIPENIKGNKFFSKIINETVNITEGVLRWLGVLGAALIRIVNESIQIKELANLFKIIYIKGKEAVVFTIDNIRRTFTIDNIRRTFYGK